MGAMITPMQKACETGFTAWFSRIVTLRDLCDLLFKIFLGVILGLAWTLLLALKNAPE
jgi:hypothetical protein